VWKTPLPLLLYSLVAVETSLFAEPLLSNSCCIAYYFMIVPADVLNTMWVKKLATVLTTVVGYQLGGSRRGREELWD
jgi:hypothetical protein